MTDFERFIIEATEAKNPRMNLALAYSESISFNILDNILSTCPLYTIVKVYQN